MSNKISLATCRANRLRLSQLKKKNKNQNDRERAEQRQDKTEFNSRSGAQKPVKGEAVNRLDLMDKTCLQ